MLQDDFCCVEYDYSQYAIYISHMKCYALGIQKLFYIRVFIMLQEYFSN
jgi:hypothetical protein